MRSSCVPCTCVWERASASSKLKSGVPDFKTRLSAVPVTPEICRDKVLGTRYAVQDENFVLFLNSK